MTNAGAATLRKRVQWGNVFGMNMTAYVITSASLTLAWRHHICHVASDSIIGLRCRLSAESVATIIRTSRAKTRKLCGEANKCLLSLERCSGVRLPVDRRSRSWVSTWRLKEMDDRQTSNWCNGRAKRVAVSGQLQAQNALPPGEPRYL